MKGCVQESPLNFCLKRVLNTGLLDQKARSFSLLTDIRMMYYEGQRGVPIINSPQGQLKN